VSPILVSVFSGGPRGKTPQTAVWKSTEKHFGYYITAAAGSQFPAPIFSGRGISSFGPDFPADFVKSDS